MIKVPDETFNFSDLSLGEPTAILNGFYYTQIKHTDDLYIQTPEITSKSGFVKTANKHYIDLIFKNKHEQLLEWFENLENRVKMLIYEKRNDWFSESSVEMSDIENIFVSPIRTYKSGRQFVLRTNTVSAKNTFINANTMKVYDSNHNEIAMDSVDSDTQFLSLLQISGIKFSSRTFQIYIEIKQIMVTNNEDNLFESCLLGSAKKNTSADQSIDMVANDIPIKIPINLSSESSAEPTIEPTNEPTNEPTIEVTTEPTIEATTEPTIESIIEATTEPTIEATTEPTIEATTEPTIESSDNVIDTYTDISSEVASSEVTLSEDISSEVASSEVTLSEDISSEDISSEDISSEVASSEVASSEDIASEDTSPSKVILSEDIPLEDFPTEKSNYLEKKNIDELEVDMNNLEDSGINISQHQLEYIQLYKSAFKKAKNLRKQALEQHLEAQNIKAKYLLNVYSDSDSDYDEVGEHEQTI